VDKKELKELMDFISQSNFVEFELEREGFKLKLVKAGARVASPAVLHGANGDPAPAPSAAPPQAAAVPAPPAAAPPVPVAEAADIVQVTCPMVGTFYRSPNPNAAPFVEVGDMVKRGQVLCIIEAMKLMNEIEAEAEGEIIDIPVSNGQPVEYGEVLFRIRSTSG